jgi:phosphinothricin acetyltransferase
MIAGISGENAAGRAFHAALGYAHIATVTEAGRKFDRWHDLVLMRKFLT